MDDPAAQLIGEHVRRLLSIIGLEGTQVVCEPSSPETLWISITAPEDGKVLIGPQGAHLEALQHIIRSLLRRHLDANMRIMVDVNSYRARREKSLFGLAEEVARKAHRTGRPVELNPMNAFDRRTVHTALAAHKEVSTESMGDGYDRRVVVRPVFL